MIGKVAEGMDVVDRIGKLGDPATEQPTRDRSSVESRSRSADDRRRRPGGRSGDPVRIAEAAPVAVRACSSACARAGRRIVVVTGAHAVETDARVVHADDWERGPGASLRRGLEALPPDAEAAVVVLADGPELAPAAIDRVVGVWRESGADVVAASYGGDRGHPVVLGREAWPTVPDEGARALEPLLVPCDDLGPPGDVDSADEWEEDPS